MQNLKNVWVALVVVAIIAIGAYQFPEIKQTVIGAVPTLDGVDNPFVAINGNKVFHYRQNINATSSVACSVKNPFNATTTLTGFGVAVNSNGLGSQEFSVSTSTGAYSSSTPALMLNLATGTGQFTSYWRPNSATTTNSGTPGHIDPRLLPGMTNSGVSNYVIGPSEYVNVRVATSTAGTFVGGYWTGTCAGTFERF